MKPSTMTKGEMAAITRLHAELEQNGDYDPLIAKLIVWAPDRPQAVAKLQDALNDTRIEGIKHNVPFLQRVAAATPFVEAAYDTRFVAQLSE